MRHFLLFSAIALVFICSCEDDPLPAKQVKGFEHGIIISNEGTYTQNNGSLSFINSDEDSIVNDLFMLANSRGLGDVVQSFAVADSLGFIIVNGSSKVEVVRLGDFKSVGYFYASYPRYFCYAGNGKGYLTNGGFPGELLVIDTKNLRITDTIPVGNQPEHLVFSGNRIFVANGKWGNDNTVSVIDAATDELIRTLVVGDGPTDLVAMKDHSIWVICQGKVVYNNDWTEIIEETDSKLVRIDGASLEVGPSFVTGTMGDYFNPYLLSANSKKDLLYYAEADGIHQFKLGDSKPSAETICEGQFYGLGVNPANDHIFVLKAAADFVSNGSVMIHAPNGDLIQSFETGIGPNGIIFY